MSNSGFETRVVSENPKPEKQVVMGHVGFSLDDVEYGRVSPMALQELVFRRTEERNDALAKIDKLEDKLRASEAAGAEMREVLQRAPAWSQGVDFDRLFPMESTLVYPWHWTAGDVRAIRKALSSSAGKEILEELRGLREHRKQHNSCFGVNADLRRERDQLQNIVNELNEGAVGLEKERDQLKVEVEQLRETMRLDKIAKELNGVRDEKMFREQGKLVESLKSDLEACRARWSQLNDQLAQASKEAIDAKAQLAEKERELLERNLEIAAGRTENEKLQQRAEKAEAQLETAHKHR